MSFGSVEFSERVCAVAGFNLCLCLCRKNGKRYIIFGNEWQGTDRKNDYVLGGGLKTSDIQTLRNENDKPGAHPKRNQTND